MSFFPFFPKEDYIVFLTHLDVKEDALMLKKVAFDSQAIAFASNVLPFPGGPNKSKPEKSKPRSEYTCYNHGGLLSPFAGDLSPWKISGRKLGRITISRKTRFASCKPTTSSNDSGVAGSTISFEIKSTKACSTPFRKSGLETGFSSDGTGAMAAASSALPEKLL